MPEEVVRNTSFSGGIAMKCQFIHSFIHLTEWIFCFFGFWCFQRFALPVLVDDHISLLLSFKNVSKWKLSATFTNRLLRLRFFTQFAWIQSMSTVIGFPTKSCTTLTNVFQLRWTVMLFARFMLMSKQICLSSKNQAALTYKCFIS